MDTIKFSRSHTLSDFNKGITDIGQFTPEDHKLLKKLVKNGTLIQYKKQWYPGLGRMRNAWINADSPKVKYDGDMIFICN